MLGTSARIGEVLAIRRRDLDLTTTPATLRICGTVISERGVGTYRQEHPKTDRSNRVIALPSFTAEALRRRLAIMADHSLDALVFRSREGTPLTTANVRRQLRKVLGDAGIEGVSPHMFRRTVATVINEQASLNLASELLGHTDPKVTIEHYIRRNEQVNPLTAELLDQAFAQDDRRGGAITVDNCSGNEAIPSAAERVYFPNGLLRYSGNSEIPLSAEPCHTGTECRRWRPVMRLRATRSHASSSPRCASACRRSGRWPSRFESGKGSLRPDVEIAIDAPDGRSARLVVEVKQALERRDVGRVAKQSRSMTTRQADVPVVAARYLSASVRDALAEEGMSYVDATGNLASWSTSPPCSFRRRARIGIRGARADPAERSRASLQLGSLVPCWTTAATGRCVNSWLPPVPPAVLRTGCWSTWSARTWS